MNTKHEHSDVNQMGLGQTNALVHMFELKTTGGCTELTVLEFLTPERNGSMKRTSRRIYPGSMKEVQQAIVESLPEAKSITTHATDKTKAE